MRRSIRETPGTGIRSLLGGWGDLVPYGGPGVYPAGHGPAAPCGRHHQRPVGSLPLTGSPPVYAYGVPVLCTIGSTLKNWLVTGS